MPKITRLILRVNASTCIFFGLLFAIKPIVVAHFLGNFPFQFLQIIGIGLVIHGAHLILGSLRQNLLKLEIYYFSAADILWFLMSLVIVVATNFVATPLGVYVTLAVAVMVMLIGLAQLWSYSEAIQSGLPSSAIENASNPDFYLPAEHSRLKAIGVSWMGLKAWVKVWLIALNIIFIASLYFWPAKITNVILASYFATAPLLLAVMIVERGLSRFLGIGHLIPWLPLLIYIGLGLSNDKVSWYIDPIVDVQLYIYAVILFVFISVCLALDIYDIRRWIGGQKGLLGSKSEQIL